MKMQRHVYAKIYVLSLLLYHVCIVVATYEDPRDEYFTHAVIKPTMHPTFKAISHSDSSQTYSEEEVTLKFAVFGKNFDVYLTENKDLFSPNYEEIYQENGKEVLYQKMNEKERRCYYKGHLPNIKNSWAAIGTCTGISGAVFDGKETYYIEPDSGSLTGEHFVFKAEDRKAKNSKCGANLLPDVAPLGQDDVNLNESNNETKYIEVIIVNDNSMYKKYNSNLTAVQNRAKQIANIASTMFSPFNIVISILKIKTWSTKDLINVTKNFGTTLNNFLRYRKDILLPSEPHDNGLLLTNTKFIKNVVGNAYISVMCNPNYSGVVIVDYSSVVGDVASTYAHELGHNFGMKHDRSFTDCQCPEKYCIMGGGQWGNMPTKWSSCSVEAIKNFFAQGRGKCLKNKPSNVRSY